MKPKERAIAFCNDLDGPHFKAPLPGKTTLGLIKGRMTLPPENSPVGEYQQPTSLVGSLSEKCSIFFHRVRPTKKESLEGLSSFQRAAQIYDRDIRLLGLSGRERSLHDLTRQKLEKDGYGKYFSDLLLNQGRSSLMWKEQMTRRLVNCGLSVVHIDDDLRAGLAVARVDSGREDEPKVLVYVLKNLSNHPWLLKRAKVELPPNLVLVNSFAEAALDFSERLRDDKF